MQIFEKKIPTETIQFLLIANQLPLFTYIFGTSPKLSDDQKLFLHIFPESWEKLQLFDLVGEKQNFGN